MKLKHYGTSFFFFKQKTAYEMRISDWSSDVCSSDLLVLAQPQIARMPQRTVGGEFGERDLGDQLWGDPMRAACCRPRRLDRRRLACQPIHPGAQRIDRVAVEPGAYLARIDERAVLVLREQQRTKATPFGPTGRATGRERTG